MFSLDLPLCLGYYFAHVKEVRYCEGPQEVYSKLLDLMGGKENYFVITTNVDGLFEKNGFAGLLRSEYVILPCWILYFFFNLLTFLLIFFDIEIKIIAIKTNVIIIKRNGSIGPPQI